MKQLILVVLFLLGSAYACDAPERVAVALGHCKMSCGQICSAFPECNGQHPVCEWWTEEPEGNCPHRCSLDCATSGGGQILTSDCLY